jgi:hypothetical protein
MKILVLLLILLMLCVGCVSKTDFDDLQTKYNKLQSDKTILQKQVNNLSDSIIVLKDNQYKLKNFSNLNDLKEFANKNPSKYKLGSGMGKIYSEALRIQTEAAKQGYMISPVIARGKSYYTSNADTYLIYCTAIVTGYGLYFWNIEDPNVYLYLSWKELSDY